MHIINKDDCVTFLQKCMNNDNMIGKDENKVAVYEIRIRVVEGVSFKIRIKCNTYSIAVKLRTFQTNFIEYPLEEVIKILFINRTNINQDITDKRIKLRR